MLSTCIIYFMLSVCVTARRQIIIREAKAEDQISESSGYQYTYNSYDPHNNHVNLNPLHYPSSDSSPYLQHFPQSHESFQYYYPDYKSFKYYIPEGYSYYPNIYKDSHKYGYGHDKDLGDFENYQYVNDKGDKYDDSEFATHGKQGNTGYKNVETYDKDSKSKYDNEGYKGYYDKDGSDNDGYHESKEYFTKHNEGGKGYKGESYGESSSHKKGSKTTGYHKVYNKNEFKKDHTFYDDSDKSGHFNKQAHGDSYHEKQKGDFEKGGQSNYGFRKVNQGENGSYDKGHYDANDSKFSDQQRKGGYQEHYSNYNENNGKTHEKQFGFHHE